MLSKAPWTAKMVCVHIRQAAIYAISKGWYLKTNESHGIQFSRAELALAAGTFLGDLKPNLPDDPDQPIFLLIHLLPSACADSRTQPVLHSSNSSLKLTKLLPR